MTVREEVISTIESFVEKAEGYSIPECGMCQTKVPCSRKIPRKSDL
jgi:hypothetical protein